jgi:DNA-binding transcriptional ArsR family regulator
MAELESNLNVLDKLRSFSVAADKISGSKKQASYHLIVLDSLNKTVQITPYSKQDLEKANKEYGVMEQRIADGEKKEAVLVSAGPVEALKRAYPNYFLDTQSFINRVRRLISESKKSRLSVVNGHTESGCAFSPEMMWFIQAPRLRKNEIPQADRFDSIRQILEAIDNGSTSVEEIHDGTGVSHRHVSYRISSAEILGALCREKKVRLTMSGLAWIKTERGSENEAVLIREMVEDASFFSVICPTLLGVDAPGKDEIANRLVLYTGMSRSTAYRRAGTLMSWAVQLNQCSLSLKKGKGKPGRILGKS